VPFQQLATISVADSQLHPLLYALRIVCLQVLAKSLLVEVLRGCNVWTLEKHILLYDAHWCLQVFAKSQQLVEVLHGCNLQNFR
jgi:hypothetical protein